MSDNITPGNKRDKWTLRATELLNWLIENKSAVLVAGDNITLTPQQDGTIEISASGGGEGTVTDVLVDGISVVNQDGEAEITMPSDFVGATSQQAGTHGLVKQPLIADKDKFLKGDGTWAEAGGGNVDDVKVNGTSVVDANKVAQITSYKEITQAEYDALPASKLTDGIAYFIKDANLPSRPIIYSPIIYSLEERCVGVWIDGKPLYEKTVNIPALTTMGDNVFTTPLGLPNVDKVVDYSVILITHNYTRFTKLPLSLDTKDITTQNRYSINLHYYNKSTDTIRIDLGSNVYESGIDCGYVTLLYTKTTDNPGSGQWAQDGIPAVHYSTDEKVIGTWIDGKTLYEKTFYYTGTLYSGAWVTLDSSRLPSNTPYFSVTNVCFISTEKSSSAKMSAYITSIPFDIALSNGEQLYLENKSNYKIYEFIVTIQYTKTS